MFPIILLTLGALITARILKSRNENKETITENVMHAHYTAGLLEDRIREIRNEDYELRKKYHELNGGEIMTSEDEE